MRAAAVFPVMIVAALGLPDASRAQDPLVLPRIEGEIRIDGVVDEAAWAALEPLPVVMQTPEFGAPPSEPTTIRVGYDDRYLYVAGEMFSDPEDIRATSFKRDLFDTTIDYLGVILDTFDDNENAVAFWTTPTGLRLDYTIYNDGQRRTSRADPVDTSWNTFWDAAATRSSAGWFAEMRIPFSSLRFQEEDGRVVIGLTAVRFISRKNETITFPAIPPTWGFWSFAKPSQARSVELEGVESRTPVYLTPYALGGYAQDPRLNDAGTAYGTHDEPTRELGVDLKYGLTNNLILDLTYNTDFAQVEADDQQINLTRFSLFFPEKRQFFLERSSVFDFSLSGTGRVFYSRRIGLHEGEVVPILGGARLVGRIGDWDVGLLDMQTERVSRADDVPGLPSENLGVVRLRRQVLNPYSYAGGIATSRIGEDGRYNFTYGVDGNIRLLDQDYFSFAIAQTADDYGSAGPASLESAIFRFDIERRTIQGFAYDISVNRAGDDFQPALGFMSRLGYALISTDFAYGWLPGKGSPLQHHQLEIDTGVYLRNDDGSLESLELGAEWTGATRAGGTFGAELVMNHEDLRVPFLVEREIEVPVGTYTFPQLYGTYASPGGREVVLESFVTAGGYFDGRVLGMGFVPTWIPSKFLQLSGYYEVNRVDMPHREQRLDLHIGRLRSQVTLNTVFSALGFLQYSSALDAVTANVRLRYNPAEGRDLYLVYNEGFNTDRYELYPPLPLNSGRALLLKYTHTVGF